MQQYPHNGMTGIYLKIVCPGKRKGRDRRGRSPSLGPIISTGVRAGSQQTVYPLLVKCQSGKGRRLQASSAEGAGGYL